MRVSGFTVVRNALRLGYPFVESVRSALPLCDEFVIGCGESEDTTRELCEQLRRQFKDKIRIIDTVWTEGPQQGGYPIKHQTDLAAHHCRGRWCLYLQADEVLHEQDYSAIETAMSRAERSDEIDGLVFDYLHFYGGYDWEIRGRNWYRREVRVFKNGRDIEAYRDAQGFRRAEQRLKVIPAGARVFHYGYVRTPHSLDAKSVEMARWWGKRVVANEPTRLHRHIGLRRFTSSHPAVMAERIRATPVFDPKKCPRKWDRMEIKNALTLLWESVFPFRLGEFRNYDFA